jgi:hypothetical protein
MINLKLFRLPLHAAFITLTYTIIISLAWLNMKRSKLLNTQSKEIDERDFRWLKTRNLKDIISGKR